MLERKFISKAFTIYTLDEIEFLNSCVEGVLICGLYKRFKSINVNIKPTITKLIVLGLIFKKDNVYLVSNKGKTLLKYIYK